MKQDIADLADIQKVVDEFYTKVRADDLLGPIFNARLGGRWPQHLQKMYNFWETILLPQHTYEGYPFKPHVHLPVEEKHFERWLMLFFETLDTNFEGEKVYAAKRQAQKMAQMFHMRIKQLKAMKEENT